MRCAARTVPGARRGGGSFQPMNPSHASPAVVPEVGTIPQQRLERMRRVGWLLDNSIPVPGTRFRLGIDQLIGLVPGIGDLIGGVLSLYIIVEAYRLGSAPLAAGPHGLERGGRHAGGRGAHPGRSVRHRVQGQHPQPGVARRSLSSARPRCAASRWVLALLVLGLRAPDRRRDRAGRACSSTLSPGSSSDRTPAPSVYSIAIFVHDLPARSSSTATSWRCRSSKQGSFGAEFFGRGHPHRGAPGGASGRAYPGRTAYRHHPLRAGAAALLRRAARARRAVS